jgi:hypothetical protein
MPHVFDPVAAIFTNLVHTASTIEDLAQIKAQLGCEMSPAPEGDENQ